MNTVLFDLDGTLLPINQYDFFHGYMHEISKKFVKFGIEPEKLMNALQAGTKAMIQNDGHQTNETRFWDVFVNLMGEEILALKPEFELFYTNEFNNVSKTAMPNPLAQQGISILKEKGYAVIAATNPVFPEIATKQRIRWAQINPDDFSLITTYENSCYGKPNLEYYRMILKKVDREASDCLMVGNDVDEDMCVSDLGMETFLLTDYLLNRNNKDLSSYRKGNFETLIDYLTSLPDAA